MLQALEITKRAYAKLNLTAPTTLLDANNVVAVSALQAINDVVNNLLQSDWNFLQKDYTVTFSGNPTTDDITGLSVALPEDYLRLVHGSVYNASQQLQMQALSPADWNKYRALKYADNGLFYRIFGGKFWILPRNTLGNTMIFSYYTKYGVFSVFDQGITSKTEVNADTDTLPFDDELMILGMATIVAQTTGINDGQFLGQQYQDRLNILLTQDGAPKVYDMKGTGVNVYGIGLNPYSSIRGTVV